jgi:hypothetical protein
MTFMYLVWTVATLAVAGYGLGTAVWHLMLASAAFNALETAGTIGWDTAKQRPVPSRMLGRVSSLDWLIVVLVAYDGSAESRAAVVAAVGLFPRRRLIVVTVSEPGLAAAMALASSISGGHRARPSRRK